MNEAAFREHLSAGGYSVGEVSEMVAGKFNGTHTHEFSASLLILEGELSVTAQGKTTTCGAGDTFALEAGTPHTEQVGPAGARLLVGRR